MKKPIMISQGRQVSVTELGEVTEIQNFFLKDLNYYQTKFQDLSAGGPRTLVRLHHGHQW